MASTSYTANYHDEVSASSLIRKILYMDTNQNFYIDKRFTIDNPYITMYHITNESSSFQGAIEFNEGLSMDTVDKFIYILRDEYPELFL